MLAALEGLPSEPEPEGPTMMGRLARELLLSGQGAAGLQQFKVVQSCMACATWSTPLPGFTLMVSGMLS